MKSQKRKKKLLAASAGLAILAMMAGTFAWYTAQDQKLNRVAAEEVMGQVVLHEEWKKKPIKPNTEAEKKVKVKNLANVPVYVRASYEEVFKYLTSKGVKSQLTTPYDSTKTGLKDNIPVHFAGQSFVDDATLTNIAGQVTKGGTAINTGLAPGTKLIVMAKGDVTKDSTGAEITSFDYTIFYEYATGKYQEVAADIKVTGGNTVGSTIDQWTFEVTSADITYSTYVGGYTNAVANWAESKLPSKYGAPAADKSSLLGGKGTNNGEVFDYTPGALGIASIPGPVSPAAGSLQVPTAASQSKEPQTVRAALGTPTTPTLEKVGIEIKYGADIIDVTGAMADAKWVYNPADGWFYFSSPLAANADTPYLLEAMQFTDAVDEEYDLATFDLTVKMEAIEANKLAVKQVWGIDVDTATGTTKTIMDHLTQ